MDGTITDNANFSIHFSGDDGHTISVDTLTAELHAINQLMFVVQEEFYPDAKIKLKVLATPEGSFSVVFDLLFAGTATLLMPGTIEYAANLCSIISSMVDLKQFLCGKKEKSVTVEADDIKVTNYNGDVKKYKKEVNKYFADNKFENCVFNVIEPVNKDEKIAAMTIDAPNETVTVDRSEFAKMLVPVVPDHEMKTLDIPSSDIYIVRKPIFEGDEQWGLVKDKAILVKIDDREWLESFQARRVPLLPGDMIRVDMVTVLEMDEAGSPVDGKAKYIVTKVHEVITPDKFEQLGM